MRLFAIALMILAGWLAPREATAAMMMHTDLASLVFESEVVVKAERTSKVTTGTVPLRDYRVLEVIHGSGLTVGDVVQLADSLYRTQSIWSKPSRSVDDVAFLFLQRPRRTNAAPPWHLVQSGLRLVIHGGVHRFEQESNPGPFAPVPQGPDPEDVRGRAAKKGLSVSAFRTELDEAIARAEQARKWLASPASPGRTDALLGILGPPVKQLFLMRDQNRWGFYRDMLAGAVHQRLAAEGIDAFVEAHARQRIRRPVIRTRSPFKSSELLSLAEREDAPWHLRRAAVDLAAVRTFDRAPGDEDRLLALMSHAEPALREAAAWTFFGSATPDAKKLLLDRWATEDVPAVRYALTRSASRWDVQLPDAGSQERNTVAACERQGDKLVLATATLGASPGSVKAVLVIVDPWRSGPPVRRPFELTWGRGEAVGTTWWLPDELRVRQGKWTVELVYDAGFTKTISVGDFTTAPPATRPEGVAPAPSAAPVEVVPPARPPVGCTCNVPQAADGTEPWRWLALAFAGAWMRRRRVSP